MRVLTSRSKWIYAFGSVGTGSLFALAGFYLLYFYTDVVRLPAGIITLGILVGRVWDILNDPIVGSLSDRTHSRVGRRRVWVIAGAIPLAITTFLLLAIPANVTGLAALFLMVLTYFLWDAALTTVHVPFYALGVESF
jgi:Na+/melibiose symporter-like transporter